MTNKCPYCGSDLLKGKMVCVPAGEVYWVKEGDSLGLFASPFKKNKLLDNGAILFKEKIKGVKIQAETCKKCKKIIIDYDLQSEVDCIVKER